MSQNLDRPYTCDLAVFKSLESCKGMFRRGDTYCAQGKLAKACGIPLVDYNTPSYDPYYSEGGYDQFMKFWRDLGREATPENGGMAFKFGEVARINNECSFEEADKLILEIAMQSGKINFINGADEPERKKTKNPVKSKMPIPMADAKTPATAWV